MSERRVGIGFDVHRFVDGRKLVLGGVELEGERGLEGHSDADVLAHAVIDAVLGAAALGDVGRHFPDDDPRYRDADSVALLEQATAMVRAAGWSVVNVDATVVCEQPKVGPVSARMCERLAGALSVDLQDVNVKATTSEGMGFTGRGEGIAALAIAQLERADG